MNKLRILRGGNYSGSSGWAQCNHKGPYKGKREAGEWESKKQRLE